MAASTQAMREVPKGLGIDTELVRCVRPIRLMKYASSHLAGWLLSWSIFRTTSAGHQDQIKTLRKPGPTPKRPEGPMPSQPGPRGSGCGSSTRSRSRTRPGLHHVSAGGKKTLSCAGQARPELSCSSRPYRGHGLYAIQLPSPLMSAMATGLVRGFMTHAHRDEIPPGSAHRAAHVAWVITPHLKPHQNQHDPG